MNRILNSRIIGRLLLFLSLPIYTILSSCSSESTGVVAVAFHNTTAHFNAYYIARNRINEIQAGIIASRDDDYDDILMVMTPLDSSIAETYQEEIQDALKKASIAIQNHKNSKWVDDSYNMVGMARLYGHEHVHAIETFRYVNTNSDDPAAKNFALLKLFRTFIEFGEMNNALTTSDYLGKRELNENELKELYLTRAYYYQLNEDYDNMVQNLVQADPFLKKKDEKARLYFIIGQVYQKIGFESQAFQYYRKTLGSNPPYELSFYSKLYMARVSKIDRTRDIKNIRKDLEKLVKDEKNKEFVDKIYYEWAEFELNQGNMDESINLYEKSIRASQGNARQKGLSYWKLGVIYYERLKEYETAKDYYDSAVSVLPKTNENYPIVEERQLILDDFVEQLNIIHENDSLIALSAMDSTALMDYIDTYLEKQRLAEEARLKEEKKLKNRIGSSNNVDPFSESAGIGSTSWYFNNTSALSLGRSEFVRIWGNRPLEDNWRRSIKSTSATFVDDSSNDDEEDVDGPDNTEESSEVTASSSRDALYNRVPKTNEDKMRLLAEVRDALYKLGNIYNFNLKEEENAITTFESLLSRFPGSEYEPEVLYQLYLLYGDETQSTNAKNTLLSQYPESTYAKLIENPNYQEESSLAQGVLETVYTDAYQQFAAGNYIQANNLLNQALVQYPDNPYSPRLELLKILIVGKTQSLYNYQLQLDNFIKKYQDEEISAYAKELLDASERYKRGLIKLKDAVYLNPNLNDTHFFFISLNTKTNSDKIEEKVEEFNNRFMTGKSFEIGSLNLDDNHHLIVVKSFGSIDESLNYYDIFKAEGFITKGFPDLQHETYVISEENFEVLYTSKELDTYTEFYKENY